MLIKLKMKILYKIMYLRFRNKTPIVKIVVLHVKHEIRISDRKIMAAWANGIRQGEWVYV